VLLDFKNETAFTGWALKLIKKILVGPGPEKSHFADLWTAGNQTSIYENSNHKLFQNILTFLSIYLFPISRIESCSSVTIFPRAKAWNPVNLWNFMEFYRMKGDPKSQD
jgi:hypothetical protein